MIKGYLWPQTHELRVELSGLLEDALQGISDEKISKTKDQRSIIIISKIRNGKDQAQTSRCSQTNIFIYTVFGRLDKER